MPVHRFSTVNEFCERLDTICGGKNSYAYADDGGSWYAHTSFKKALELGRTGDAQYVAAAEAYIRNIEMKLPETKTSAWVRSPFGTRVRMGEYLAGSPTPMRRRVKLIRDTAPVRVVVSVTCSGGIEAIHMQRRGEAILGFLLKAQQIRPVELYTLIEMDSSKKDGFHYSLIRIEGPPMNIAQAAFALSNVGFARHGYEFGRLEDGSDYRWPKDYSQAGYAERRAQRLGLNERDIVIKEAFLSDALIQTPEKWIQEELDKLAGRLDD